LYTEPSSDFLEGLLVGAPPNGSEELAAVLRRAGVSHLVAVSGYNLTILTGALGAFFFPLFGRGWGSAALALVLIGFAGVSGFEPSVMRAGAMAGLQLVAYLVGRPAALPRLLALAVLVMVWAAPGLLLFDLGFQLSVAATAGIAFAARPIERRIGWLPDALGVRSALATSLAALAATVPVLVLTVGRVSVVAPFTTAILTPFVPSAMGFGGLSLLLAVAHPALALPVAAVEQMLLAAMLAVAGWFGRLPFAAVAVPLPALVGVAAAVLLVRRKPRRLLPVLPGWVHRP
jgi:competence protein ComEC